MHYMHRPQRESFAIQVSETLEEAGQAPNTNISPKFNNLSSMKLFNRFRKILMRLIFSIPSRSRSSGSSSSSSMAGSKQKNNYCDKFDPPKTSCSSYYSSQSHYSEAIADCIEFFNKSSQEGILDGRKSDVFV
ncbi:hypothetical protein CCACVL1_09050 [Corchorus capsularis]|uniref:Uncharacterized protein n=1 Tax=Corchorus capsularis TaxID=210143 RepID=A0A1R3IXU7_COCAP|nr:hypothetical protein CCACVL1_09050 [Corchorus capsularis]